MESKPLNPLLGDKVVNIADIRAQRMAALDMAQIQEAEDGGQLQQLGAKETVFLRNMPFFLGRLARPDMGDYGRVAFQVGVLEDGSRVMLFTCDPYEALYAVNDNWQLDFSVDPLITRWSVNQPCEYTIVQRSRINFTEIS